jgi:hypothetical protein
MSEKLCPCCNRAALSLFDGVEMPNEEYAVCVGCEKCGLAGPDGETAQHAWKLWDKNATIILAARLNETLNGGNRKGAELILDSPRAISIATNSRSNTDPAATLTNERKD